MLPTKAMPPQAVLRDYFDYIPSSGDFTWKDRAHIRKNVRGQIAGSAAGSTGYRAVMFKKKIYQVYLHYLYIWEETKGAAYKISVFDVTVLSYTVFIRKRLFYLHQFVACVCETQSSTDNNEVFT